MSEFVGVHLDERHPGVATMLLGRPPRNMLTRQFYRELTAAADNIGGRADICAVVIFGGHEVFSAGDDLDELASLTVEEAVAGAQLRQTALHAVAAIPVPTVAAVTGYALGAGLGLALTADRRISGDNARLGCTDILAGLTPVGGTVLRLTAAVGPSAARDLVLSGRFLDAEEALRVGLVDELAAPDGVYDAAVGWAGRLAATARPALAAAKAALRAATDPLPAAALAAERDAYRGAFADSFSRGRRVGVRDAGR